MNSVVPEARITLDARLLRKLIVVLSFKEAHNPRETRMVLLVLLLVIASYLYTVKPVSYSPSLVINFVSEARRVDDGEEDAGAFLLQLYLCEVGIKTSLNDCK
jgi:hypothetical protein